jgi:starch phosphorylase
MIETIESPKTTTSVPAPTLPFPLQPLARLAWNYWWSWAPDGEGCFRDLDAVVWEECEHNPRLLLARVSEYRLAEMATDPVYIARVGKLGDKFDRYLAAGGSWTNPVNTAAITPDHPVAYFCAEFGVHNSLPVYSGGLGVLAGDHLKSASDLRLPLVAVGLLYREGYFRQRLNPEGWQEESYEETDPAELPLHLVTGEDDKPLFVEVLIRGRLVRAQVWRAAVGRVALYLLDTNISENEATDRWVTGHLYGGDRETRIVQEMLLGIGGVRLLRKLGVEPHVFHLNEGHSAFLTLELARELIQAQGLSFAGAATLVKQRSVFTTHTPVAAGNDEFDVDLLTSAVGPGFAKELGLSHEEFLALGRIDATNPRESFGLTPLAIRMCRSTNGVSRKHGEVSRALWRKLSTDTEAAPITHVTNGVHAPTWVAPLIRSLYEDYVGDDWPRKLLQPVEWQEGIARISDEELWAAHSLLKARLVAFIRQRSFQERVTRGDTIDHTEAARNIFEPGALTIGFARRVAGYKRWNLLLRDPARLLKIINHEARPVQFVFAGKAHPQDAGSKLVLQQVAKWKYDPQVRNRAVFIEDYDHAIARQLVQSVDVWLNVPRRPLEASGTSGEKVAINGGLNLSVLDGWWLEGYDGTNGFAIGDTNDDPAPQTITAAGNPDSDAGDAESLYRLLEQEVVPLYYDRDAQGLPRNWISMMKRSITTLVPEFNSDRMVEEYARRIYS